MKTFEVTGIVFDTDGESQEALGLSDTMVVECESEDEVVDAISDETGWLVSSVKSITEI